MEEGASPPGPAVDEDDSEASTEVEPGPHEDQEEEEEPRQVAGQESQDAVDLLGLHEEAGAEPASPSSPSQARGVPSSNAELLSSLLGPPEASVEQPPDDLLGGEAPPLSTGRHRA